jgi:hypothetical protein
MGFTYLLKMLSHNEFLAVGAFFYGKIFVLYKHQVDSILPSAALQRCPFPIKK